MVDAIDSKSITSNGVRVQVPWLVPIENKTTLQKVVFMLLCIYMKEASYNKKEEHLIMQVNVSSKELVVAL